MKNLELKQMEQVQGGLSLGCAFALAGAGLAFAGLFFATAGAAAVIEALSWSIAPSATLLTCMKQQ